MYCIEPRKVPLMSTETGPSEGWRMICRDLRGTVIAPVSGVHPTSDAARRDPLAKAWSKSISDMGIQAIDALVWAHARCQETAGLELGMPKEVLELYRARAEMGGW